MAGAGFERMRIDADVLIFPNPSENRITLVINQEYSKNLRYTIYNISGRAVESGKLRSPAQNVDISSLSSAVYLLDVYDRKENGLASEKFIKE